MVGLQIKGIDRLELEKDRIAVSENAKKNWLEFNFCNPANTVPGLTYVQKRTQFRKRIIAD